MHVCVIREIQLPVFAVYCLFSSFYMYMSAPVGVCALDFSKSKHSEWVERNLFEVIVHFTEGNDDMLGVCVREWVCGRIFAKIFY